ncbi:hypothetical protein RHMOL_Rhmol06G0113000 [Rhododendron molle]|uniref:Uncharacterized protein n=1 Tax=Rhododendron molle TaxID=49168 RepID=A0ACC0NBZ1_RHOML|nr:hypothetical protein RHMOL_Rhmol06G0113000 [Rhododendron molle]
MERRVAEEEEISAERWVVERKDRRSVGHWPGRLPWSCSYGGDGQRGRETSAQKVDVVI